MSHRELESMEIVTPGEETAAERAALLLNQARQQIALAKSAGEGEKRLGQIDYGHLFKHSRTNDLTLLKPSIKQRPAKRQNLVVSLAELYAKKDKKVRLIIDQTCGQCQGKKSLLDTDFSCSKCSGTGEIRKSNSGLDFAVPYQRVSKCDQCGGNGSYVPSDQRCWQCLGTGFLAEPVIVNVPLEGVQKDIKKLIVLEQKGDCGLKPGEAAGDLEFAVELLAHPSWALVGEYFYAEKRIPVIDALMGKSWKLIMCDDSTHLLCRCEQVVRDDQLIFNDELKIMIRVRYEYPDAVIIQCPQRFFVPTFDATDTVIFRVCPEEAINYYQRQRGNQRQVLKVLE